MDFAIKFQFRDLKNFIHPSADKKTQVLKDFLQQKLTNLGGKKL